jgi:hypothetical protein
VRYDTFLGNLYAIVVSLFRLNVAVVCQGEHVCLFVVSVCFGEWIRRLLCRNSNSSLRPCNGVLFLFPTAAKLFLDDTMAISEETTFGSIDSARAP